MTADLFDTPMTDAEMCEVATMPNYEIYLLTQMVPRGTTRAKQVREVYLMALDATALSQEEGR